jgi:hypothetical protein
VCWSSLCRISSSPRSSLPSGRGAFLMIYCISLQISIIDRLQYEGLLSSLSPMQQESAAGSVRLVDRRTVNQGTRNQKSAYWKFDSAWTVPAMHNFQDWFQQTRPFDSGSSSSSCLSLFLPLFPLCLGFPLYVLADGSSFYSSVPPALFSVSFFACDSSQLESLVGFGSQGHNSSRI